MPRIAEADKKSGLFVLDLGLGKDAAARWAPAAGSAQRFDLAKRKLETVFAGIAAFRLTPDGKKTLTLTPPETWAIQDVPPALIMEALAKSPTPTLKRPAFPKRVRP